MAEVNGWLFARRVYGDAWRQLLGGCGLAQNPLVVLLLTEEESFKERFQEEPSTMTPTATSLSCCLSNANNNTLPLLSKAHHRIFRIPIAIAQWYLLAKAHPSMAAASVTSTTNTSSIPTTHILLLTKFLLLRPPSSKTSSHNGSSRTTTTKRRCICAIQA